MTGRTAGRTVVAATAAFAAAIMLAGCAGGTAPAPSDEPDAVTPSATAPASSAPGDERTVETWEPTGSAIEIPSPSRPGTVHLLFDEGLLFRDGTEGVNLIDLTAGASRLVAANGTEADYEPLALVGGELLYRAVADVSGSTEYAAVTLDGAAPPRPFTLPETAVFGAERPLVSADPAGDRAIIATQEEPTAGFEIQQLTADGETTPIASVQALPDVGESVRARHFGAAGGAWWFGLVPDAPAVGSADLVGLYRVDLESGESAAVDPGMPLTSGADLYDAGDLGAVIADRTGLLRVTGAGEVLPLASALLEAWQGTTRNLVEHVHADQGRIIVSGAGSVEIFDVANGTSVLVTGSCGMPDQDRDCPGGSAVFDDTGRVWLVSSGFAQEMARR